MMEFSIAEYESHARYVYQTLIDAFLDVPDPHAWCSIA